MTATLPAGWTLAASAFNVTPEVIRAARAAPELALSLIDCGVSDTIEIEPGQMWRGFPAPSPSETGDFRAALEKRAGRVSIVGGSIDEWTSGPRRRTEEERYAFLLPQLHAAAAVGAAGIRVPIGQPGAELVDRLLPVLDELDLILFEEVQGRQTPADAAHAAAYDDIIRRDHPRLRLLLDISMLMPALPETHLAELERGGVSADLVGRLRTDWADPATQGAVFAELGAGRVPPAVHTLFMDLVVRFGRSRVAEIVDVLPWVGAVHLKFWDLDDADDRVSAPIRELAPALRASGFAGTLCSEWGGHEWLEEDPWDMTRRHLALAVDALADGLSTHPHPDEARAR